MRRRSVGGRPRFLTLGSRGSRSFHSAALKSDLQQTPSAARPHKIEQTVEDEAPVGRRTTPVFNFGQQGFEEFPLSGAQIGRIQITFCDPCRGRTVLWTESDNTT